MNSNENKNQLSFNGNDDINDIHEIEAMLEKRSETPAQNSALPAPKKYLRKTRNEPQNDSTIIINKINVSEDTKACVHDKKPANIPAVKTEEASDEYVIDIMPLPARKSNQVQPQKPVSNVSNAYHGNSVSVSEHFKRQIPPKTAAPDKTQQQNPQSQNNINMNNLPFKNTEVKAAPGRTAFGSTPQNINAHQRPNIDNSSTIAMPAVAQNDALNVNISQAVKSEKAEARELSSFPIINENDDFDVVIESEENEKRTKGSRGKGLINVFIYLSFVFTVAIIIALFTVNVANDVFAFKKPTQALTVVVPENCTTRQLADILEESGAISFPRIFTLYTEFKKNEGTYVPGTYVISPSLNYDAMIAEFKQKPPERTTVTVTIPEGFTTDQIVSLLVSKGLGTYDGYERAINEYEYDFEFLKDSATFSKDRIWKLEGYLYPDTYYYFSTSSEEDVIYKMLQNFDNKLSEEYYNRANELGMSLDDLIILASMIQKEVKYPDEFGYVSSVFHNRLNNPGTFPRMESDATIVYAMNHEKFLASKRLWEEDSTLNAKNLVIYAMLNLPEVRETIENGTGTREKINELISTLGVFATTEDIDALNIDTKYASPYNSYTNNGLPPGPISNPSIDAIKYAMYPNTSSYYYFVSGPDGRTTFCATYYEHQNAISRLYPGN